MDSSLRANTALREEYAGLKQELARRHPADRVAYTEGKSAFIDDAQRRAGVTPRHDG